MAEQGQSVRGMGLGGAFILPFALAIIGDRLLIGREYFSLPNDNATGWFGLALNWIALEPQPFFHHPGYTSQALAGLILALAGQPGDAPQAGYLDHFNNVGVAVQWAILLGAALWAGRLGKLLAMGVVDMLVLGAVVVTMPTMLIYAWMWGPYFPFGTLVVPAVMALVWAGRSGRWTSGHVFWALATLGLLVANLYFGAIVIVAALFAFGATYRLAPVSCESVVRKPGPWPWVRIGVVAVLAPLFATSFAGFAIRAAVFLEAWPFVFAGLFAVTLPGLWWADRRAAGWPRLANAIHRIGFPLLLGWGVGGNVLAPLWGLNARSALLYKGGAAPDHFQWAALDPAVFLSGAGWHLTIPVLLIGAGAFALLRHSRTMLLAAYFVGALVGLNLIVAADVTLLGQRVPSAMIGQLSRYYIAVLAAVPVFLIAAREYRTWLRWSGWIALTGIAFLAAYQYVAAAGPAAESALGTVRTASALMEQFLRSDPMATVICLRSTMPEPCAILYGYNNYRTVAGAAAVGRTSLFGGRVVYAAPSSLGCQTVEACRATLGLDGPTLVFYEAGVPARAESARDLGNGLSVSRLPPR